MNAAQKHIVFDWNGTLFDDIGALHGSTNSLLQSQGHAPVTLDFFQSHYDIPFQRLYHNLGLDAAGIQRLIDANNGAFHDYYEPLVATTGLRSGGADILHHAHKQGVASYILSNHLVEPIRGQLRRLGIDHFFAEVIAYADRAAQKARHITKGEKLRQFRADQGIHAHPTMIVGDSIEEIEIARAEGLISVAITGGCVSEQRLRAEKPDYLIHSLHELKPILEERGFA